LTLIGVLMVRMKISVCCRVC